MRGGLRGSWSNTSLRYLVSTSTIKRVCANTRVLSPDLIAMRAMRLDCERADARRPRSLLTTGGFHSSTCLSPVGAPDSVDRKSTRLNPVTNAHLVCRLLLEKKKTQYQHN